MSRFTQIALATAAMTVALTASMSAGAQAPAAGGTAAGAEVSIPFVNRGGVRDWQAVGDNKVYIQDSQGKWYLVTLATSSPDLPFATAIGFETKGLDQLDKFGTIVVSGQRYPLSSLVVSGPPPPKPKK